MDPHCIHGVLLLVERDLTFRMEKPPAGQVMEPFIQGLLGSSWYPLFISQNSEFCVCWCMFILAWNLCSCSLYFMVVVSYGCGIYRLVKFMQAEHISVCCICCRVHQWHLHRNDVSLLGPSRHRGFVGSMDSCIEEPCTINSNRDAFQVLLLKRGEIFGQEEIALG